jgi:hypothetical protein
MGFDPFPKSTCTWLDLLNDYTSHEWWEKAILLWHGSLYDYEPGGIRRSGNTKMRKEARKADQREVSKRKHAIHEEDNSTLTGAYRVLACTGI